MDEFEDLPPAFSRRERQRDPILAAAESNHLFEAFRRHRSLYPRLRGEWWRGGRTAVFGLCILAAAGALAVAPLSTADKGLFFCLLVAGPAGFLWRGELVAALVRTNAMYFGWGRILAAERRRSFARDLWLAGATGRCAVEAIYLEFIIQCRYLAMTLPPAGCVLVGVMGAMLGGSLRDIPLWLGASTAFLLLGDPGFREVNRLVQIRFAELYVDYWRRPPQLFPELELAADLWVKISPAIALGALVLLPPITTALALGTALRTGPFTAQLYWLTAVAWLVGMGVGFRFLARWLGRKNAHKWDRLLEGADAAFATFFRRVLMGDPDG